MPPDLLIVVSHAHIEGLLHLGAVAFTVVLAYFGLDRMEKLSDPIGDSIDKFERDTRSVLESEGYLDNGVYCGPNVKAFNGMLDELNALCCMGRVDGFKPRLMGRYWLLQKRADKFLLKAIGTVTPIIFLLLVWESMWPETLPWLSSRTGADLVFSLFVVQIFCISAIVAFAKRVADYLCRKRAEKLVALKVKLKDISNMLKGTWVPEIKQGIENQPGQQVRQDNPNLTNVH